MGQSAWLLGRVPGLPLPFLSPHSFCSSENTPTLHPTALSHLILRRMPGLSFSVILLPSLSTWHNGVLTLTTQVMLSRPWELGGERSLPGTACVCKSVYACMCMSVCMYMCACTCICTCTHTCVYARVYARVYTRVCVCMCVCIYLCVSLLY